MQVHDRPCTRASYKYMLKRRAINTAWVTTPYLGRGCMVVAFVGYSVRTEFRRPIRRQNTALIDVHAVIVHV